MKSKHPQFTKPNKKIDAKADKIISRMTLEEKISLLGGQWHGTLPCERVGIPMIKFADGPVGVHWWCDASTAYPATIGVAASFNKTLARKLGNALGRDCRARGVHMLLAPGVNIYRSPLCGRNFEYLGEDPYLSSRMVVELTKGVQSQAVSVTVKHYAVNYQEYDRHGISSDVDERTLREVYLPAFEAAVREAGAGGIMTAYNLLNGEHCSQHDWLINQVLKGEWKFQGLVMSDWTSTYDAVGAANGGLDLEMPDAKIMNAANLMPAIENGLVSEETINEKIRRLLRLAYCFGWMDHEQKDESIPLDDPTSVDISLQVARESCVLLKNDGDALPLHKDSLKTLAVIGYQAHPAVLSGGGSAYTKPFHEISVLDALREKLGADVEILHCKGYEPSVANALRQETPFRLDNGEVGVHAEFWTGDIDGDPNVRTTAEKACFHWGEKPPQEGFDPENFSFVVRGHYTPETSGEHVLHLNTSAAVEMYVDGEQVFTRGKPREGERESTIPVALQAGQSYEISLVGRIKWHWNQAFLVVERPGHFAGMHEEALNLAARADAVVFCGGFSTPTEGEGHDRSFDLPGGQAELLLRLAQANPDLHVLLFTGGGVNFHPWLEKVKSVLQVWYPGQEGGRAIAEILLGEYNPTGKLPITMEHRLEDRSSHDNYHDHDGDNRVRITDGVFTGYRHFDRHDILPLFPFGFGLSYTTFALSNLRLSENKIGKKDSLKVTVNVKNTGLRTGSEVVQVYVSDLQASQPRPPKECKGFKKVTLKPGQDKDVTIKLDKTAWRFWTPDKPGWVTESGVFEVHVGTSSRHIATTAKFRIKE
jgi:beta-glucosidase